MIKYYYEIWQEFKDFGGSRRKMLYITENKEIAKDMCRRGNNENCVWYNPNIKYSYEATAYESSEDDFEEIAENTSEYGKYHHDGVKPNIQGVSTVLLNDSITKSPEVTCVNLEGVAKIIKKEPEKVAISTSPCKNCEAQVDADSAQGYCDECRSNSYSHHFNDFTDTKDTKLQRLANQVNALVELVKELGFKEFITNQYGEYMGYNYNGFNMNEESTDKQIERFNLLKNLLLVKIEEE